MKRKMTLLSLLLWACLLSLQCQAPASTEITLSEQDKSKSSDIMIPTDSIPEGLKRILKAYPGHFKGATSNSLIWMDGTEMPYDDGKGIKEFRELLNEPDLEEQVMSMLYPKGIDFPLPPRKQDPGRVRYEPFFLKMYGKTAEEVKSKLTTIVWLPKLIGTKIQVTTVNDVHLKLQAISEKLDKLPHLKKYLENPGGTFNWRTIAGTNRLSTHSFGMTIDINVTYSNYWRWELKQDDEDGTLSFEYKNRIPLEIVAIFEEYGFIWGGKWNHYDSMHFEYRPELLVE